MVAKGQSRENPLDDLSNSLTTAVEKASKFTLMVDARRRIPASGIAYQQDLLLTADHVVEREDDISVVFPDGNEGKAAVVGRDPGNDLVVLRLDQPLAEVAQPASQDALLGQIVLAIGRPSRRGVECSFGVISAKGGTRAHRSRWSARGISPYGCDPVSWLLRWAFNRFFRSGHRFEHVRSGARGFFSYPCRACLANRRYAGETRAGQARLSWGA
ncbi:MAG: trypsin-like peptidase domain-containing protein [Anaerolineales bacterium]